MTCSYDCEQETKYSPADSKFLKRQQMSIPSVSFARQILCEIGENSLQFLYPLGPEHRGLTPGTVDRQSSISQGREG